MLRVGVLGQLTVEVDGSGVELPTSRRARALLGLLAVERRTHSRSQLAARFWPDVLDESARTSLRAALSALRKVARPGRRPLPAGRSRHGRPGRARRWCGRTSAEFESLLAAGRSAEALALSRGELLEGLDDEWILQRARRASRPGRPGAGPAGGGGRGERRAARGGRAARAARSPSIRWPRSRAAS